MKISHHIQKILFLELILFLISNLVYSQNVVIDSIPYQDGFRKVRLFIPKTTESKKKPSPLLILLDGQNLFDYQTSFAGEWQVDEFITSLPPEQQAFAIGIDHGNDWRLSELTPFKHEHYGGGGATVFLEWIINKVLPTITTKYTITLDPNHTAIAGSSLGGLFAHYAATMHPEIFMSSGIFSPALWIQETYTDFVKKQPLKNNQFFFLSAGTAESPSMIPDMRNLYHLLIDKQEKIVTHITEIQDAQHNEAQWRESFQVFYKKWLAHIKVIKT